MISRLLLAALFLAAASHSYAQVPENDPGATGKKPSVHDPVDNAVEKRSDRDVGPISTESDKNTVNKITEPTDYVRPVAKQRFTNYMDNLAGPISLGYYAGAAGLLTLRNSPKEWGDRSDGYGRRFANVAGKNAIRSTVIYALDEVLNIDSAFYRSRDRGVAARLRNCVFSAVTARNKKGRRVIGIPAIVGGILSEVASSSGWYPSRYDYVHGLKGGAISIGITTGMNLFKEFVWKP